MTTPSPHLDLDALADALAGEESAADADHLAGCGSCAGRLDELRAAAAAVRAQLGTLALPPLPAELAERLDAVLAEQEPLVPAREASVRALPQRRARRTPQWLPAAAAAVIVLGGAGFAVSQAGIGSDTDNAAGSAAGGATAESAASPVSDLLLTASGADWADPATPQTALPRVLDGEAGTYSLPDARLEATERDGELTTSAEDQQAPAAADPSAEAPEPAAALPEADGELARLSTSEGLEACLSSLLEGEPPGTRPLAVDYATYDGEPALAVVLPDPDPAQAAVFVVGADCSAADADLLLFRRAPLP